MTQRYHTTITIIEPIQHQYYRYMRHPNTRTHRSTNSGVCEIFIFKRIWYNSCHWEYCSTCASALCTRYRRSRKYQVDCGQALSTHDGSTQYWYSSTTMASAQVWQRCVPVWLVYSTRVCMYRPAFNAHESTWKALLLLLLCIACDVGTCKSTAYGTTSAYSSIHRMHLFCIFRCLV